MFGINNLADYEPYLKKCSFSTIYILESKQPGDAKNGVELFQWLKHKVFQHTLQVEYHEINSKKGLIRTMNQIRNNIADGYLPFIHFEMHGNPKGLQAGKDLVEWSGVVNLLRTINITTQNNLIATFAVCNAFFIYPEISIFKKSPLFGFVANVNRIKFGEAEEDFHDFFDELLTSFQLDKAMEKLNKNHTNENLQYSFRFSVNIFEDVWTLYNEHAKDKDKRKARVLNMMSMALNNINIRHKFSLSQLRYEIEQTLSDDSMKSMKAQMLKNFMDMS